jgi:hypothetical protein
MFAWLAKRKPLKLQERKKEARRNFLRASVSAKMSGG